MRALLQRVSRASVSVEGAVTGRIGAGLLVLVGVTHDDEPATSRRMAEKLWHLRVFEDDAAKMNRSVADTTGEVLVVSQFTLYGDTRRGRRPGYTAAAPPEVAEPLVEEVAAALRELGASVAMGVFGADMRVGLVNEGPVTLMLEV